MPVKSVKVNLINHPLSREEAGVTFDVDVGGAKFGELIVSKGGIRWKPKGQRDHHHASWEALNKFMADRTKK